MRENISQARRYREMVRIEFWRDPAYPDLTCDLAFRHYLESKYEEAKSNSIREIKKLKWAHAMRPYRTDVAMLRLY